MHISLLGVRQILSSLNYFFQKTINFFAGIDCPHDEQLKWYKYVTTGEDTERQLVTGFGVDIIVPRSKSGYAFD